MFALFVESQGALEAFVDELVDVGRSQEVVDSAVDQKVLPVIPVEDYDVAGLSFVSRDSAFVLFRRAETGVDGGLVDQVAHLVVP